MDNNINISKKFELKRFSNFHHILFFIAFATVCVAYYIVNFIKIEQAFEGFNNYTTIIILTTIIPQYILAKNRKKALVKIWGIEEFSQKVNAYFMIYKQRIILNVCMIALFSAIFVVTKANFFFYFLLFDLLVLYFYKPNKRVISMELREADIYFKD